MVQGRDFQNGIKNRANADPDGNDQIHQERHKIGNGRSISHCKSFSNLGNRAEGVLTRQGAAGSMQTYRSLHMDFHDKKCLKHG